MDDHLINEDHWLGKVLADVENKRSEVVLQNSLYGAADMAAKYCGFSRPPLPIPGHWQHGWKAAHRRLTPQYEMGVVDPLSPKSLCFVARKDQEEALHEQGFHRAKAIGLPCVYTPRSRTTRHENSLLVMPGHSLDYTRHDWKFDDYADEIESIRGSFDEVIVCIHQSCFDRGIWIDSFHKRNIPVVTGAHTADPLSLYRLEALISSFGYVTTNSHGSHIAYAAFWGAKVSIFGTYAELRAEDYFNTPFYQRFPELLRPSIESISEETMRQVYPQLFFDDPKDAQLLEDWASQELGADQKHSPEKLKQTFHWNLPGRFVGGLASIKKWIDKTIMPKPIRQHFERKADPELKRVYDLEREVARIAPAAGTEVTCRVLQGKEFRFWDGPQVALEIRLFIIEDILRFSTLDQPCRIIDVCAGFGVATLVLAQQHPDATVIAYEPNEEKFKVLQQNIDSFDLTNVEMRKESMQGNPADKQMNAEEDTSQFLAEMLQDPVSLLRLDFRGKELALLENCQSELANVSMILIHCWGDFDEKQSLPQLFELLQTNGFRVHIRVIDPAKKPFEYRPVIAGCDQRLLIFAFRDNATH